MGNSCVAEHKVTHSSHRRSSDSGVKTPSLPLPTEEVDEPRTPLTEEKKFPFREGAKANKIRRVAHQILFQRLYKDAPPPPELLNELEDLTMEKMAQLECASSNESEHSAATKEVEEGDEVTASVPVIAQIPLPPPAAQPPAIATRSPLMIRNPLGSALSTPLQSFPCLLTPASQGSADASTHGGEEPVTATHITNGVTSALDVPLTESSLRLVDSQYQDATPSPKNRSTADTATSRDDTIRVSTIVPPCGRRHSGSATDEASDDTANIAKTSSATGEGIVGMRRRSNRNISVNPAMVQYLSAQKEVKSILNKDSFVSFVVTPELDTHFSVHTQLVSQNGSHAWKVSGLPLPILVTHHSKGNGGGGGSSSAGESSLLMKSSKTTPCQSDSGGCGAVSSFQTAALITCAQGETFGASNSGGLAIVGGMKPHSTSSLHRRNLHVSPKCLGYLTEDVQRQVMKGKADNAHFEERTTFVREHHQPQHCSTAPGGSSANNNNNNSAHHADGDNISRLVAKRDTTSIDRRLDALLLNSK